ncbi:MAG: SMC-Scp complex subunit ScpB [Promethearchaeota archaeon]
MDNSNEEINDHSEKEDNGIVDDNNFNEEQKDDSEVNIENTTDMPDNIENNAIAIPEGDETDEELIIRQMRDYHKNLIEASLYVAGSSLSIEELNTKLEISKKEVEELINELAFDYLERSTALVINRVGDESYQMSLKTEFIEKVSKFAKGGAIAERYLRTLTVIALKQPILKSLVIKLRGAGAYEHVKYLLDNELISAVKKGRSQELTTTDKYAEMFGLPKNKEEMKRLMVSQLGLDNISDDDNKENNENSE